MEENVRVKENSPSTIINQLLTTLKKENNLLQDCKQHHSETWVLALEQFESNKHHSQQELQQEADQWQGS